MKPLKPQAVLFTRALPKTRNAKVMRRGIRATHLGEDLGEDLAVLLQQQGPEAVELDLLGVVLPRQHGLEVVLLAGLGRPPEVGHADGTGLGVEPDEPDKPDEPDESESEARA